VRLPKPPQASCTCSPDIDDDDWQCCELCKFEAYCDDERDKQRDDEAERDWERQNERDYHVEVRGEHDPTL